MLSFLEAGMETFLWLLHEMLVAGLESVISVGDACRRCKRLRVFLPRESPWTEDPGRLQPIVLQSWTQLKQLSMHITVCVCVCVGFPGSSAGKKICLHAGDPSSISGLGSSPGEGIGYPLQCSWAFLVAQTVKKICLQCGRPRFSL